MVQIISPSPRAMQAGQIGQALGIGINKNFPDPQQLVQRRMLQESLQKAKSSINQPGATPLDKMFDFMEAGAGIPGSERYMGALLPLVEKLAIANAGQNAPYGLNSENPQMNLGQNFTANMGNQTNDSLDNLNNFLSSSQNNLVNENPQQVGNLFQETTERVKQPILSNKEMLRYSKPYAKQKSDAGILTTPQEAYEELKSINADNILYNEKIEKEKEQRVKSQREYGELAASKLQRLLPNASDEEVAYIKKQGEKIASKNFSEAEIEKQMAAEARAYKNMIAKVDAGLPAMRVYNRPYRDIMGNSKESKEAMRDLRVKIQPLLDAGLFDKARNLLSNKNYYPEEREAIMFNLGEQAAKSVNQMNRISSNVNQSLEDGYYPEQEQEFKQNLLETLQNDPSVNLILLRKKYEDEKGVNWKLFKEGLNDLVDNKIITLNPDQFNQLNTLDQPRLDLLDKILFNLGISGS